MVDPLIQRRGYLCNQAKIIDNKLHLRAALELTLSNAIHLPRGGRVKGGLKANAGKEQLIRICIAAWGVVRVLKKHDQISQHAELELELFIRAMENAENDAIADSFFDDNCDLNANSMKMPPGEQGRGYLEDGATLPAAGYRKCAACGMKSVHHPPGTDEIKEQRKLLTERWKKLSKQWNEHMKNSSIPVPVNPKNDKPYTKPPDAPKLPKILLVCKASKMKETHGTGGFKCDLCNNRSCDQCKSRCRFVCCTE